MWVWLWHSLLDSCQCPGFPSTAEASVEFGPSPLFCLQPQGWGPSTRQTPTLTHPLPESPAATSTRPHPAPILSHLLPLSLPQAGSASIVCWVSVSSCLREPPSPSVWGARHLLHLREPVRQAGRPPVRLATSQASPSFVFRAPVLTMGTWEGQILSPEKRKRKEVPFTGLLRVFPCSSWDVLCVCVCVYVWERERERGRERGREGGREWGSDVLLFQGGGYWKWRRVGGQVEEEFLFCE